MRRREFIAGLGGAVAWPVVARGQQIPVPVIGFLHSGSEVPWRDRIAAFREGLTAVGLAEGRDFVIEFRWAEGNYERVREMAEDLVSRNVTVIVAGGGVVSAPVAKAATSTIPIVFLTTADPVAEGLVKSLARPGGNMTGVHFLSQHLGAKRLGYLNLLTPGVTDVGVIANPNNPGSKLAIKEIQDAALTSKRTIHLLEANSAQLIDEALDAVVRLRCGAVMVHSDPFLSSRHAHIVARVNWIGVPAIYGSREYVLAGGLMSYGADPRNEYRTAAAYTGQILRGARPADLPVIQPTKFELLLNLKTARSLRLHVPDHFQLLADEVIE
jgi:putative tryptophan/tyrosine transport system substrate-binding protein